MTIGHVRPVEIDDRIGERATLGLVELLQVLEEQGHDLPVVDGLTRRIDRLPAPLDPATGVGDGAPLLVVATGRKQEDLGVDGRGVHTRTLPEARGVGLPEVDSDHPVELLEGAALEVTVRTADCRVLSPEEQALDDALVHILEDGDMAVVLGLDLGHVVVAEVVLEGRVRAPPLLELRDQELGTVRPVSGVVRGLVQVLLEGRVGTRAGDREVRREVAEEQTPVGGSLNVGLATEGVDAAAGASDVTEERLNERDGTDVLSALGVLGESHRVHEDGRLVVGTGGAPHLGDLLELGARHTTHGLDHLGGVADVLLLHELEDAVRILKGHILLDDRNLGGRELRNVVTDGPRIGARGVPLRRLLDLVAPGRGVVLAAGLIETRELAVVEGEIGIDEVARVGERLDVVLVPEVVIKDVLHHRAEEHDVGALADGRVEVSGRCASSEARVDDDVLRALLTGCVDPTHRRRVVLGVVRTTDHDEIGVLRIGEVVRHGSTTE